ncbi:PLDc N-terminal domain-containing protein [Williamsia sterculiae]|uniref:PLDc N-terminal domain-containing protein n=1 Tax=Williamsia sterculiae TaxID=1344003 RepID=UPI00117BE6BB
MFLLERVAAPTLAAGWLVVLTFVSYSVIFADTMSLKRRTAWLCVVWLLPVVGTAAWLFECRRRRSDVVPPHGTTD